MPRGPLAEVNLCWAPHVFWLISASNNSQSPLERDKEVLMICVLNSLVCKFLVNMRKWRAARAFPLPFRCPAFVLGELVNLSRKLLSAINIYFSKISWGDLKQYGQISPGTIFSFGDDKKSRGKSDSFKGFKKISNALGLKLAGSQSCLKGTGTLLYFLILPKSVFTIYELPLIWLLYSPPLLVHFGLSS